MTTLTTAPATESAKMLKAALRKAFPTTRFRVRLSRGTAYGYCHVSWTDGPTTGLVEEVAAQYEGSRFDGMIDMEERIRCALPDGRQTGLRGISCDRTLSDRHVARLIEAIGVQYGTPAHEWPTVCEFRAGRTFNRSPVIGGTNGNSWESLIWRASRDRTAL